MKKRWLDDSGEAVRKERLHYVLQLLQDGVIKTLSGALPLFESDSRLGISKNLQVDANHEHSALQFVCCVDAVP